MKFILIRHAQSAPNSETHQSEWTLTAQGEQSCRLLADFLRTQQITHIYSSHEIKAIKTAELSAQLIDCETTVFDGLEEQNNDGVGWFESSEDFKAAVQKLFEQPNEPVFGAETASQAAARFRSTLSVIAATHQQQGTVGITTHGRVMTAFLQSVTDIDAVPFWRSLAFPHAVVISWPDVTIVERKSFSENARQNSGNVT